MLFASPRAAVEFPVIPREEIGHLIVMEEGMPQVDWGMAAAWMVHREPDVRKREDLKRAVVGAWLDEVRDAVKTDSRRWRRGIVEGVAPLEGSSAVRLAEWAEKSIREVTRSLVQIRGDATMEPIAVVGMGTRDEYYAFVSHFYPEGGSFATSGGMYIRSDGDSFPMLAINAQSKHGLESTVAHELTHHALHGCGLPLWAEEGLTQMMEERVTGLTDFVFNHEMRERQRGLWLRDGFGALVDGSGFHCPDDDVQELSYHMAQVLVRSLLSTRSGEFFAFARGCATTGADLASKEYLGETVEEIAEWLLA